VSIALNGTVERRHLITRLDGRLAGHRTLSRSGLWYKSEKHWQVVCAGLLAETKSEAYVTARFDITPAAPEAAYDNIVANCKQRGKRGED
jgi:hypothetical protein